MLFYYPTQAQTVKDVECYLYQAYDAIGINMNKYNNDSSNTFLLIKNGAEEIFRSQLDMDYMPTFSIDNIDFTTIDRINRFNISQIFAFDYNTSAGYVKCDSDISGYCAYTDTTYNLENVNTYTDFTRHSIPCDVFLENKVGNFSSTESQIILLPNIKNIFSPSFKVNNSKATINILNLDLSNSLIGNPILEIEGLGLDYTIVKESINIDRFLDIITSNEYSEITSITLLNVIQSVTVYIYPFILRKTADMNYLYTDREDLFKVDSLFTLDALNNKLQISAKNQAASYPAALEPYEAFNLNIPQAMQITYYHFDFPNRLLYTIMRDAQYNQYLSLFPLTIPDYTTNYGQLKNTTKQAVTVSYVRDTINKKYIFTVFPINKEYNVEALDIYVRHSYKNARGLWKTDTEYNVGDLVLYNNNSYICKTSHLSDIYLDTDSFVTGVDTITQDFLLELITYNIETNTFEIPFDLLFKIDIESVVEFQTYGTDTCVLQILAQYHSLDPIILKDLRNVFAQFDINAVEVDDVLTVAPIKNETNVLLANQIEAYNYKISDIIDFNQQFKIFETSNDLQIKLNNYIIRNIYKTFFLDWPNKTIITSDTITHIFNNIDTSSLVSGESIIATPFGINMSDYIISDNYLRVFLNN